MPGTNAIARLRGIGIGEDVTAFGTYQAPGTGQGLLCAEGVNIVETLAVLEASAARQTLYANATERVMGRKGWTATLPFTVPLRSAGFKMLMKQAFGTAGGSGPFVYVKATSNLALGQCLQMHTGDGVNQISASGGRPKTLKFSVSPAGLLKCDATLVGSTYAVGASAALPAVTLDAEPYWTWRRAAVAINGAASLFSGFDLDIDLGVADDDASATTLGSQVATSLPFNGNIAVKGNLTRLYISDGTAESAFDGYARTGAEGNVVITFTSGDADVLAFAIECVFGKPTISGSGLITETIPFECRQVVGALSLTNGPFAILLTDGT
jgi:hypothetical protein